MATDASPNTNLVTSSRVLRDYLYSRLRSGASLTLSDKLLGLVMLGRESARVYNQTTTPGPADSALPPQIIGHLKGYLLNSRGNAPGDILQPDITHDYLNDGLCGRVTKLHT